MGGGRGDGCDMHPCVWDTGNSQDAGARRKTARLRTGERAEDTSSAKPGKASRARGRPPDTPGYEEMRAPPTAETGEGGSTDRARRP